MSELIDMPKKPKPFNALTMAPRSCNSGSGMKALTAILDREAFWQQNTDKIHSNDNLNAFVEREYFSLQSGFAEEIRVKNRIKRILQYEFGLPEKCNYEIVSRCVLRCDFCVLHSGRLRKRRQTDMMTIDDFDSIFRGMERFTTHIEFTGGEPLLNDDLFMMLKQCNDLGIKTTVATNAALLDENRRKKLLDNPPTILLAAYETGEETSYNKLRKGASFFKMRSNIRSLSHEKKLNGSLFPRIQLQMVVSKKTLPFVDDFWEAAKKDGADTASIKPILVWPDGGDAYHDHMIKEYLIPGHRLSYHSLASNGGLAHTRKPGHCPNVRQVHIGCSGEVIPCWFNLLSMPSMGNCIDSAFLDVWFSNEYKNYRKIMVEGEAVPHCRYCIGIYDHRLFRNQDFTSE